jgi:hypothetical protein
MDISALVKAAQDPTLIPGIYDMCDQWCAYCPATTRCLAWRAMPRTKVGGGDLERDVAERMAEGVELLKGLWTAEEREATADAVLAAGSGERAMLDVAQDPLVRMAERYLELSSRYLRTRPDFPFEMQRRPTGPTPFEIFAWYHALLAAKVYRSLFSSTQAAFGDSAFQEDALASAKVALIGLDRSLDALTVMALDGADPRLPTMETLLRRLRQGLEQRFPGARSFVRAGLDTWLTSVDFRRAMFASDRRASTPGAGARKRGGRRRGARRSRRAA